MQSRIFGDAVKLRVEVQRSVVACKHGIKTGSFIKLILPFPARMLMGLIVRMHAPLKRATERESDNTVKTTTALRASQLEETV